MGVRAWPLVVPSPDALLVALWAGQVIMRLQGGVSGTIASGTIPTTSLACCTCQCPVHTLAHHTMMALQNVLCFMRSGRGEDHCLCQSATIVRKPLAYPYTDMVTLLAVDTQDSHPVLPGR
jgi:hypothetical protein